MNRERKCGTYVCVCVCNGMLLSRKKDEIMPFAATWMQLEIIILSEVSQKEKDKYHITSLRCGILKYGTVNKTENSLPVHKTKTDSQTGRLDL